MRLTFTIAYTDAVLCVSVKVVLRHLFSDDVELREYRFRSEEELREILRTQECDLVVAYLHGTFWNLDEADATRARIYRLLDRYAKAHPEQELLPRRLRRLNVFALNMSLYAGVRALKRLRAEYQIPIIALQGMDFKKEFAGSGVVFLESPFDLDDLKHALRAAMDERVRKALGKAGES